MKTILVTGGTGLVGSAIKKVEYICYNLKIYNQKFR